MTKRDRNQMQTVEMKFLRYVEDYSLLDKKKVENLKSEDGCLLGCSAV
jgi:hypothetical protein